MNYTARYLLISDSHEWGKSFSMFFTAMECIQYLNVYNGSFSVQFLKTMVIDNIAGVHLHKKVIVPTLCKLIVFTDRSRSFVFQGIQRKNEQNGKNGASGINLFYIK